jgi:hypothetical protein
MKELGGGKKKGIIIHDGHQDHKIKLEVQKHKRDYLCKP